MSDLTRIVDGHPVPIAGSWKIDQGHTSAAFAVRHLFTLVRGRFREVEGTISIGDDPSESSVSVTIAAETIDTANPGIDDALRGDRWLDVEAHPEITFVSTGVNPSENGMWTVTGDLTLAGTTRSLDLETEFLGAATSPLGELRKASFTATTRITREMYGLTVTAESPDTSGVYLVGNNIDIVLDIEADLVD